jgi:prepilin-type N-terminal cleavage/methylation domain-containing protein|nr:prepilin-type N-terminal cleavage/methylation domain-containing protein [Kofleriaceae bacterium]
MKTRKLSRNLAAIVHKGQRGMTLLEIMIVLAILALIMGLVVGPRVMKMFGQSKNDIAKATAKSIAYEAYPQWSTAHPGKQCPDTVGDLAEYMNDSKMTDPWGGQFKFLCGPTMPAGSKGVLVISPGEDGKEGTSDDVKSSDD